MSDVFSVLDLTSHERMANAEQPYLAGKPAMPAYLPANKSYCCRKLLLNIPCSMVGLLDLNIPAIGDSPNTGCGSISHLRDRDFLYVFATRILLNRCKHLPAHLGS